MTLELYGRLSMTSNSRTWLIRTGTTLLVVVVISFMVLMMLATIDSQGVFRVVLDPTAKGGSVIAVTIIVLIPVIIVIVGVWAINRLLKRYHDSKTSPRQGRGSRAPFLMTIRSAALYPLMCATVSAVAID